MLGFYFVPVGFCLIGALEKVQRRKNGLLIKNAKVALMTFSGAPRFFNQKLVTFVLNVWQSWSGIEWSSDLWRLRDHSSKRITLVRLS